MPGKATNENKGRVQRIRAALILKGMTIAAWCRVEHVDDSNLHKALNGRWRGDKARELVARIEKAAGL